MKRVVAFVGLVVATQGWAGTYTLDQLIESGLKSSKQIKMVEEEMRKTDAQIRQAYGSALPKIDASVNLSHAFKQYSPFAVDIPGMGSGGPPPDSTAMARVKQLMDSNTADSILYSMFTQSSSAMAGLANLDFSTPPNSMALTLSLTQPIFAQGKVGIGLKIAKTYREGLKYKHDFTKDTITASITKLFYAALLAQKNLVTQQEGANLTGESHRLTVARFVVGKGSELDTLTSKLAYERSLIELQSSQGRLRTALEALSKQTGVDERPEAMVLAGEFPSDQYSITLEEAREKMKADNLVLKQLEIGEHVQAHLVDIARSDFYPMVYAGASAGKIYQFDRFSDIDFSTGSDAKVFIGASMNLFDGLQKSQKVKQAQSDRQVFEHTKRLAADGLEIGLRKTYEDLQTARTQLEQSELLLALAQKGYNISKVAYEIGQITLVDFQKRELDLENAKIAKNAAQFAYHSAVVDMKVLTGEF